MTKVGHGLRVLECICWVGGLASAEPGPPLAPHAAPLRMPFKGSLLQELLLLVGLHHGFLPPTLGPLASRMTPQTEAGSCWVMTQNPWGCPFEAFVACRVLPGVHGPPSPPLCRIFTRVQPPRPASPAISSTSSSMQARGLGIALPTVRKPFPGSLHAGCCPVPAPPLACPLQ